MSPTLERVTFKTKPDTPDAVVLAAAEKTSAWLREQPGFGYRTMIKEDDLWSDLAFWASDEAAKAANAAFATAPENAEYLALIQMDSVVMTSHAQLLATMAQG